MLDQYPRRLLHFFIASGIVTASSLGFRRAAVDPPLTLAGEFIPKRCRVLDRAFAFVIYHDFGILCSKNLQGKVSTTIVGIEVDPPFRICLVRIPDRVLDILEADLKQSIFLDWQVASVKT